MILKCNCESEYQDKKYGKGKRLHNPGMKGNKCTICGNVKTASATKVKK